MRSQRGFTLIEIIIVVAIIGILAAIGYPSYLNQIRKGNRAAAQAVMMDIANKQQFYVSTRREYLATDAAGLTALGIAVPAEVARNYTVRVDVDNAATPPAFTIVATAVGSQAADGDLTLDHRGQKTPASKW